MLTAPGSGRAQELAARRQRASWSTDRSYHLDCRTLPATQYPGSQLPGLLPGLASFPINPGSLKFIEEILRSFRGKKHMTRKSYPIGLVQSNSEVFTGPASLRYPFNLVEATRGDHLKMIQEVISRLATCSFQLKGWVVTLAAALQVLLESFLLHKVR
jgi:hypothetical protein